MTRKQIKIKPRSWEKNVTTLREMKLSTPIKKKLKLEAKRWVNFIEHHIDDMHQDKSNMEVYFMCKNYHIGEIDFIKFFFDLENGRPFFKLKPAGAEGYSQKSNLKEMKTLKGGKK